MIHYDVVVVGGGIVGTASAYFLARKGHRVLVLDQFGVPNQSSASGDHARAFRLTFGKDLFYTDLAVRSLALWKEFQKEAHEDLYVPTGLMDIAIKAGGYEEACFKALTDLRIQVVKLSQAEIKERYRVFNPRGLKFGVFHPDGGLLRAQRSVAAFKQAAERRRAHVHQNTRVAAVVMGKQGVAEVRDASGRTWHGASYLFAAGAWTRELLSRYGIPLKVTRQQVLYFQPPRHQGRYRPGPCPVFSCHSRGFYVLPVHIHGFMKMGISKDGPASKPDAGKEETTPSFERACRTFLRTYLPALARFEEAEGKVSCYNSSPDGDFIVDRLPDCPNAFVATGFGGSGFTFAPLVGSMAADLVTTGRTDLNISRFRLGRFKAKG